jgi:hypothetical protein
VQVSESTDYVLSKDELYYWDPYFSVPLRQSWNGHNVIISGWIDINWTDWYGRVSNGDINADEQEHTFYW